MTLDWSGQDFRSRISDVALTTESCELNALIMQFNILGVVLFLLFDIFQNSSTR